MVTISKKGRKINFELLRILAMFFIVLHHCTINGLGLVELSTSSKLTSNYFNYAVLSLVECFSIVGVNLFFLLSGYFGIKFNIKKLFILLIDIYFYSTIIRILGLLVGKMSLNTDTLMQILFPLPIYWFILVYVLLMFVSPFLNILVEKINKEQAKLFFIMTLGVFGIFSFVYNSDYIGANGGYSLVSAAYLYIVGGVMKKFDSKEEGKDLWYYIIFCLFNFALTLLAIYVIRDGRVAWKLYAYNNILIILASIFLFRFFSKLSINDRYQNIILYISNSTLAVYFLHSSSWLADIRNIPLIYLSSKFSVISLLIPLIMYSVFVFIVCILIDKIKKILFDKVFILSAGIIQEKLMIISKKLLLYVDKIVPF